eukprot:15441692-Alexandrium_andersonii.AAC.1
MSRTAHGGLRIEAQWSTEGHCAECALRFGPLAMYRSRKMQNSFRRSELELRGPRNDLKAGPRSSQG